LSHTSSPFSVLSFFGFFFFFFGGGTGV
jgi:hypothetical protein